MNRTLFQIADDVLALDALLNETEGDVGSDAAVEWIEQWMAENSTSLATKVDNYAALISEYEARAAARSAEAHRLAVRAKAETDRAKWLKERLKEQLLRIGTPKVEGTRYTVSVQTNGGFQPVEITGDVPPEYRIVKSEPDKAAIRTALLEGNDLPFAQLLPRGESLRIR